VRNLWKSAVAIVAISASLGTGLAEGATVRAHDAGGLIPPVILSSWVSSGSVLCAIEPDVVYACSVLTVSWKNSPDFPKTTPSNTGVVLVALATGFTMGIGPSAFPWPPQTPDIQQIGDVSTARFLVLEGSFISLEQGIKVANFTGGKEVTAATAPIVRGGTPLVNNLSLTRAGTNATVAWQNATGQDASTSSTAAIFDGTSTRTCTTAQTKCVFSGVPTNSFLRFWVSANTTTGALGPAVVGSQKQVAVVSSPQISWTTAIVTVVGLTPLATAKVGVPGVVKTCLANRYGYCRVTFSVVKPGAYPILATSLGKSSTGIIWHPLVSCPPQATVGKTFTCRLSAMPPSVPIVIKTTAGQVLNATSRVSGTTLISIPATQRTFLGVTAQINGIQLPAVHLVQVS